MTAPARVGLLPELARLYGVQTVYADAWGRRRRTPAEAVLVVLAALGAPVTGPADVTAALRSRRLELWQRCCDPVTLAWAGADATLELRLPAHRSSGWAACRLTLEDGEEMRWDCRLDTLPAAQAAILEGVPYIARAITLPPGLPAGYHRFTAALKGSQAASLVIAAPRTTHTLAPGDRPWGVFFPLYALHSKRSWGAGDFGDLETLLVWAGKQGSGVTGTLPLLAAFLDEPYDPSPYAPASRLFWNEFYLDITQIPELEQCPQARELLEGRAFRAELGALRAAPLVDYRRQMTLKRQVLAALATTFFAAPGRRAAAFRRFVAAQPAAEDYARFRATVERRRAPWTQWPDQLRDGVLKSGDYDPEAFSYHLYVQWQAEEQMQALADRAREHGPGLYLDLPLGAHAASYDVWRERDAFALAATAGAPPDPFFPLGQDWALPVLHPGRIRDQGYRYVIACLRHHLRKAGVLRIDHVMGLHRLFWVPRGMDARDGVYVRYSSEELYAILALESTRHRTLVVGEDLGTVPRYVRPAMARHGVHRMYMLPFELSPDSPRPVNPVPAIALAGLNTHDLPPFAAWWRGLSSHPELQEALLRSMQRGRSGKGRSGIPAADARGALQAFLAYLGSSPATIVTVALEDLWLEEAPQNLPGTGLERPNWRRKARHTLEDWSQLPNVLAALAELDQARKRGTRP